VQRLASEVKTQYPNGIEALVNNAGVNLNPQGYSVETIEQTMRTNFYGTQSVGTVYQLCTRHVWANNSDVRCFHTSHPGWREDRECCKCGRTPQRILKGRQRALRERYQVLPGSHGPGRRVRSMST
jgi:NAD(P)-dependent dehydrogenase (short-subunit alcohol dehydrogenase family)